MKLILFTLALTSSLILAEVKKPNIILIMADDMGYEWYNMQSGSMKKASVMARTQTHQLLRKGLKGDLQLSD